MVKAKERWRGSKPFFGMCHFWHVTCIWTQGLEITFSRQLQELEARTETYEKLLRELLPGLDSAAQITVQDVLTAVSFPFSDCMCVS